MVVSCLSHHDEKLGLHTARKWTMPESWRTSMFFFLLPHKIQYFKVVFHWHDPYLLSCHTSHFTLMFWGPFSKQYVHSVSLALVPAQVEIKHLWHIPAPGQPQPSQLSSHLHHNQIFFLFLWTCHPLSWNSLSLDILFCKPWLTLSSTNESALCTKKKSLPVKTKISTWLAINEEISVSYARLQQNSSCQSPVFPADSFLSHWITLLPCIKLTSLCVSFSLASHIHPLA